MNCLSVWCSKRHTANNFVFQENMLYIYMVTLVNVEVGEYRTEINNFFVIMLAQDSLVMSQVGFWLV